MGIVCVPSGTCVFQLRRSINISEYTRFCQILPENSIQVRYESLRLCVHTLFQIIKNLTQNKREFIIKEDSVNKS